MKLRHRTGGMCLVPIGNVYMKISALQHDKSDENPNYILQLYQEIWLESQPSCMNLIQLMLFTICIQVKAGWQQHNSHLILNFSHDKTLQVQFKPKHIFCTLQWVSSDRKLLVLHISQQNNKKT